MKLIRGDCLEVLTTLDAESIDAVVTDPPYGLEFMGKEWDGPKLWGKMDGEWKDRPKGGTHPFANDRPIYKAGPAFQAWCQQWATEALRVTVPGGYLLAMGGTRTYHRLACAVEDAGFEIRDCIMWLYGSGFPKGKGCLKPAYEPILVCRKPGPKVLPLGIDACRVPANGNAPLKWERPRGMGFSGGTDNGTCEASTTPSGRWPANVVHDGSDEVLEAFAAFGESKPKGGRFGLRGGSAVFGQKGIGSPDKEGVWPADAGGTAARFFYCAKASRRERNAGLEGMPLLMPDNAVDRASQRNRQEKSAGRGSLSKPRQNTHPCVKPLALMEWLIKLVCPPGGVCLDPFLGSGTTGAASVRTGREFIGIEIDKSYFRIAQKRIGEEQKKTGLFCGVGNLGKDAK